MLDSADPVGKRESKSLNTFQLYLKAFFQFLIAPFEILLGVRKKFYVTRIRIAAPPDVVWGVLTADDITFDGMTPVRCQTVPHPDDKTKQLSKISIFDQTFTLVVETVARRENEHLAIRTLAEGSDPEFVVGDDYLVTKDLEATDSGTTVVTTHQVRHNSIINQLTMPFSIVSHERRLRAAATKLAAKQVTDGQSSRQTNIDVDAIRNALLTGVLTFASFLMLFDWTSAAILIALILIHEVGHVIAMRQMGHAIQGIYFVPFMGGVAVSQDSYANEGERGYIALMGPGFSVLTTAMLAFFAHHHPEQPLLSQAAYLSAILNAFNLLPVLPLDGGHVVGSLLSRGKISWRANIQRVVLVAAIGLCAFNELWLGAMIAMMTLVSLEANEDDDQVVTLMPTTKSQQAWLAVAFVATFAFYVGVIFGL